MAEREPKQEVGPISVPVFAQLLAFAIGGFALAGVVTIHLPATQFLWLVDLDRELNFSTFFSAWLLFTSGWLIFRGKPGGGRLPLSIGFLALLFVFMGADECLKIHETLEKASGVDWQILYLPLILAAGIGWIRVVGLFRGVYRWLWVAGAVAWASSQLFEAAQWGWWSNGPRADGYPYLMIAEEILEMSGSALFLIAIYAATTVTTFRGATRSGQNRLLTSKIFPDRERHRSDS